VNAVRLGSVITCRYKYIINWNFNRLELDPRNARSVPQMSSYRPSLADVKSYNEQIVDEASK
jgi:hypothetical protein